MIDFWLDNFMDLFSPDNFNIGNGIKSENYIKLLNIVALLSIIIGIVLVVVTKNPIYFGFVVIVLSFTILIKSNITTNYFTPTDEKTNNNNFDTGVSLIREANAGDPQLYVSDNTSFKKGDVIVLNNGIDKLETLVVSGIASTTDDETPVVILLNTVKTPHSKYTTKITKVTQSTPTISPTSTAGMTSIINANPDNLSTDPFTMGLANYPKFALDNQNRNDWNLELSSMVSGQAPNYEYQGQPYGDLKCRPSSLENPMGTINITEYDNKPTMYGTCNVGEDNNDYKMTTNQEATVSQRVDDILFHKGNSQAQFSPVSVDILPNDQTGFAHFLYRNPTNLVNPKYASIFVNDPDKYKIVSKLARATGTENGGGGGGGGRPG